MHITPLQRRFYGSLADSTINGNLAEKHSVVFDLLGGNPADLLLPANFMIVEGPSEVHFLTGVIQRFYQDKPSIQILPAGGDDEAQNQSMNGLNKALFVLQTADFINQAGILLWQGLAIFSQQFPEGIVYQGLWPIFIAEQSVTRKEP
ncbi:hypothetical protein [Endozoicomonas sp. SCSIO W0465]|uniref:hypothetical protein n=1 Tax=Endozoicomonas sp. SCSIO W0465 TaxID=2918516 RepID=UPI002075830C|nr:hypothetical protein [Endozoicomonas sp. SCSIO W0465]USE34052.1 hypothetical protein MJO57_17980 [Endozoicomonas sp. SCSIO W0465]